MPIQQGPQKISGDGIHYGAGTRRFSGETTGPARQTPPVNAAAQSGRAAQAKRGDVAPDLNSRTIQRTELGNPDYYGLGG